MACATNIKRRSFSSEISTVEIFESWCAVNDQLRRVFSITSMYYTIAHSITLNKMVATRWKSDLGWILMIKKFIYYKNNTIFIEKQPTFNNDNLDLSFLAVNSSVSLSKKNVDISVNSFKHSIRMLPSSLLMKDANTGSTSSMNTFWFSISKGGCCATASMMENTLVVKFSPRLRLACPERLMSPTLIFWTS